MAAPQPRRPLSGLFGGAERRAYTMYWMNEFRLFAHGVDFDPESFLASTSLQFDGVWHKGESGHDHPKSSGVFKVLGDGLTVPVWEQERIAIDFLSANRAALKALAQHPQVTTFILGLQYYIELDGNTVGFCMGPSAGFMRLCLDIGISPTYYVTLDREREWAGEQDAEPDGVLSRGPFEGP
jgi:hypothetical protein